MNHIKKCGIMAMLIALVQSFAYRELVYEEMTDYLIQRVNFGKHLISSGDIVLLAMDMFPVILYEMVFGVYIYRRFTTASVYFFSRQDNRTGWFLKESMKLLGYTFAFFVFYAVIHMAVGRLGYGRVIDRECLHTAFWCILLQTMYTFVFVFWINLLSILMGGQNAVIAIMGVQYLLVFLLQVAEHDKEISDVYTWKLYMNPIANVVAAWHSDIGGGNLLETLFPTWFSFWYFLFLLSVSLLAGGIVIKHKDIALEDKEEQG